MENEFVRSQQLDIRKDEPVRCSDSDDGVEEDVQVCPEDNKEEQKEDKGE